MHKSPNLRNGRFSELNRVYLLTTVTLDRKTLFKHPHLACPVIDAIKTAEREQAVRTLCWVLMPDHLHWLAELRQGTLAGLMGRLKSRSTLGINRAGGTSGPVWQRGYHDHALRQEEDLMRMARYVVANPIRAGIVACPADYPFWDACWRTDSALKAPAGQ